MIEWDDKYKTGVEKIDEQHKMLFSFFNDLEECLHDRRIMKLEDILKYIEVYTRGHFGHEEKCMHAMKCPIAQQNQNAHANFMKDFHGFQERCKSEGESKELIREIHGSIESWLVNHICKIDVHLRDCATS